jgi:hypothetical protein
MPCRRFFVFAARCFLPALGPHGRFECPRIAGKIEEKPCPDAKVVVPVERIELPTFGLQNRCSTAELNRRIEAIGEG